MCWGITIPWNLCVTALIGIWLMFEAPYLHTVGGVEITNHVLGALVCAVSIISMAEIIRATRYVNILFGICIAVAPFVFEAVNDASFYDNILCGIALIALTIRRGKIRQHYGHLEKWIV